jgi:pyruvate-formate lyase-activating enzyme
MSTYCPLPWIGLNILPNEIRPCCHWDGAPEPLEKIREDMLNGKELSGCKQCYFAEQLGTKSKRQQSIEKYGIVNEVKTQLLEITFDNICNLKCRGCCSFTSHMWHSDETVIYGKPFIDTKYVRSDIKIDCSNLTQIDISGGEPFLSKDFERFICNLDNIEDIDLGIVTSGYTRPSEEVFNALASAKTLNLTISVDAIGELNNYFRSGSDFETVLKNIEYLNTLGVNCTILIHSTVSIYNVTHIKEVEDYFLKLYPHFIVGHRILQWPEQLAIQNMPDKLKDIVRPIVESFGPGYEDVINAINLPGKDVYGHFLNYHNMLDKLRNEQLPNVLLNNYISENPVQVDSVMFFKEQVRG